MTATRANPESDLRNLTDALQAGYVATWRAARRFARTTGLLGALDRRYRRAPRGPLAHARTLFAIHDAEDLMELDVPWWTYRATSEVERFLARLGGGARVFEFGSGASTVWLARRSAKVVSVEHHAGFAAVVRRELAARDLDSRVELLLVEPVHSERPATPSRRRNERDTDFTDYAATIGRVGGEFDLISVDGRARAACLAAALPHLAEGGVVVFDDSQRPRYREALERSGLAVHRHRGLAPSLPYPRETSVLSAR